MLMLLTGSGSFGAAAYSIFPLACPADLDYGSCAFNSASAWSFFLWGAVALLYGYFTRRWSLPPGSGWAWARCLSWSY